MKKRNFCDKFYVKLFNFRSAPTAALAAAAGISFMRDFYKNGNVSWGYLYLLPLSAALLWFSRKKRAALMFGILALAFGAGASLFARQTARYYDAGVYYGKKCVVIGRVVEKRDYPSLSVLTFSETIVDGNAEKGTLVATLPPSFCKNVRLSDEVIFEGIVENAAFSSSSSGEGSILFDGISAENLYNDVRYAARDVENFRVAGHTFHLFSEIRERIRRTLYAGMDEETAAVTYAILTGDSSGISAELLSNIRYGGVAHIFAVSGLHMGALYALCKMLFEKTRLRGLYKPVRFALVATLLWSYAGICGYSASSVRACVTCLIFYASALLGIKSDFTENLGIAAILLIFANPAVIYNVGFRLSFGACLGISTFSRGISDGGLSLIRKAEERVLHRRRVLLNATSLADRRSVRGAVSFLSASLSAQIGTAPFLLNAFGYISLWGSLLNIAFVPFIGVVFAPLAGLVFFASVFPAAVSGGLLFLPAAIWSAILLLFHAFDYSAPVIGGFHFAFISQCFFYGIFFVLSDKINLSPWFKKYCAAVLIFLFAIAVSATNG